MKALFSLFLISLFFLSWQSEASTSYMSGTPTLIQQALQDIYGINAGVGPKNGQCILCHNTETGGSGNLNAFFGLDFHSAAIAEGYGTGGQNRTRVQLSVIFDNLEFAQKDSDRDGTLNGDEFENNTDPSENVAGNSATGGGGCGSISTRTNNRPGHLWLLAFLPLLLIAYLKRRVTTR